jgi:hypothetical protein
LFTVCCAVDGTLLGRHETAARIRAVTFGQERALTNADFKILGVNSQQRARAVAAAQRHNVP